MTLVEKMRDVMSGAAEYEDIGGDHYSWRRIDNWDEIARAARDVVRKELEERGCWAAADELMKEQADG